MTGFQERVLNRSVSIHCLVGSPEQFLIVDEFIEGSFQSEARWVICLDLDASSNGVEFRLFLDLKSDGLGHVWSRLPAWTAPIFPSNQPASFRRLIPCTSCA
jgi:hypothetical protein